MECYRLRLRGSHILSSHRQTKTKREIKDVVNQKKPRSFHIPGIHY